jgi:Papain-like cysteine protease AvrRpt2
MPQMARTSIAFAVPLRAQRAPDLCWIACTLMMEDWFYTIHKNSGRPKAITVADHMNLSTIGNPALVASDIPPLARYAGLEIVRKHATGAEVFALLEKFGPLWYAGANNGYRGAVLNGHAVVIRGMNGADVLLNDPAPDHHGATVRMRARDFFAQLTPIQRPSMFLVIRADSWPRR